MQRNRQVRELAIVVFLGLLGAMTTSSCSGESTGSSHTSATEGVGGDAGTSGAAGMGGNGGGAGMGGAGGMAGNGGAGGTNCVPTTEWCDGKDDDCDGVIDNDCKCKTGDTQACYAGPDGTIGVGTCIGGTQTCGADGTWGACDGQVLPANPEACDGLDDDCDGVIDPPPCACIAGEMRSCYTGPMDTQGIGMCMSGTQTCDDMGQWSNCAGETTPQIEICDQLDNNCDGMVDDGNPESGQACATPLMGVCNMGLTRCDTTNGVVCDTVVLPGQLMETCNGLDDDCDGMIDQGNPGGGTSCVAAALGECTKGTGVCLNGAIECMPGPAVPEICDNLDNDCNGVVDQGNPGGGASCAAVALGECTKGTRMCLNGAIQCEPAQPQAEICDGLDNDCNGVTDQNNPGAGQPCVTPLMGLCNTGSTRCDGVNGLACDVVVFPGQVMDVCNGIDDDCNGSVDQGNPGGGLPCVTPLLGQCSAGLTSCQGVNGIACQPLVLPGQNPETCNSKDDDCDGLIDESIPQVGQACTRPFMLGICAQGTYACPTGAPQLSCVGPVPGTIPEACNGKDDDCNGTIDDPPANPACAMQYPNAQFVSIWACAVAQCLIAQCMAGHADVDGLPSNGCEATVP